MAKPDAEMQVAFLRHLYPEGPWVLTAIHPTKRSSTGDAEIRTRTFDDIKMALGFFSQHKEWNLYYNVNPTQGRVEKKPEAHEIAAVHYLHVDKDAAPGETLTTAWERIFPSLDFPPGGLVRPTAIIESGGGGANALWALESPVIVEGSSVPERAASADHAKGYSYQIELIVGGADACHNIDRILRMPGTLNWPTAKKTEKFGRVDPTLAKLAYWDPARVYPLSKFVRAPSVVAAPRSVPGGPTRHDYSAPGNVERLADLSGLDLDKLREIGRDPDAVLVTIKTGLPPEAFAARWGGDRSKMVLWTCCELVRAGVRDDIIYSIITDPTWPISAHVLDQRSGVRRYAERQISRAHDRAISEELDDLNQVYAAIEDVGGKCVVIKELPGEELTFLSPGSFREWFANRFVEVKRPSKKGEGESVEHVELGGWWWRHPMRRQFSRIVFEPERKVVGAYNLWRGFTEDPVPGDWSMLRELMLHNLCRGNQEHYDYLIRWVAYAFQHPAQQSWSGVVLYGDQGTGKGTFAHTIGSLWGRHYFHLIDSEHLVGRFTGHLRDKLFVFADEAFFAGDHRGAAKLKGIITEPTLKVEDKYLRVQTVPNYLKLLVASNQPWVVSADPSDRRWFVLETAKVTSAEVKKQRVAIDRQMDAGGRAGLLYDMLHMDLSTFDITVIPQTEGLADQKVRSMTTEQTWWMNKLYSGELTPDHAGWDNPVIIRLLVDDYYNYHMRSRRGGSPLPEPHLGKFIRDSVPDVPGHEIRIHQNGKSKYLFPPLDACRRHWEKVMRAKFPWPSDNTRPDAAPPQQEADF